MTAAVGSPVPGARRRELYLDALRTAAIVRVVVYHTFGGAWLSWAFPAMGVMFALAGGLMVNSLTRKPPATVIRSRLRRLLPALWVFGAVMIPVMIWQGGPLDTWTDSNSGEPLPLWRLAFWLVPLGDPPGNEWGENATVVLWYLRTYLWLVLLSPLMLAAFRRLPIPTLVAPLGLLFAQAFGVLPSADDGLIWAVVSDLGIFAPCWMLGFAHRTGALKRLPIPGLVTFVVLAGLAGIAWALSHPSETDDGLSYDLNGIPIGQAFWSIAVILPLLRFAPDASWIGRTPVLGRFVALVNARAVTIYLWHNILIDVAFLSSERLEGVGGIWESGITYNPLWMFTTIWVLIAVAVVVFGWVEDLAAQRRPRLWPVGPSARERRAEHEEELARAAAAPPDARAPDPAPPHHPYPGAPAPHVPAPRPQYVPAGAHPGGGPYPADGPYQGGGPYPGGGPHQGGGSPPGGGPHSGGQYPDPGQFAPSSRGARYAGRHRGGPR